MDGEVQDHPAARQTAPGTLRLVQEFVNTVDLEEETDRIGDAAALTAWLREQGLLGAAEVATARDQERAVAIREAVRGLLLANTGAPVYPIALSILNRTAAECPIHVRFLSSGGTRLDSEVGGAHAAMARILMAVHAAMSDGTWGRLKACRQDTCRWAFYDRSKNRSRAWCSMAVCGNRAKARSYRERQGSPPERE
ncbi:MAG: CGNR zinc finger domain-containing protein [Candidatus Dormibacteraceae bacterium]